VTLDTLVLLPGLDGTGTLFGDLISELPPTLKVNIARYPTDRFLSSQHRRRCAFCAFSFLHPFPTPEKSANLACSPD
jgi:hypothetical protein